MPQPHDHAPAPATGQPLSTSECEGQFRDFAGGFLRHDKDHLVGAISSREWQDAARQELAKRRVEAMRLLEVMPLPVIESIARGDLDPARVIKELTQAAPARGWPQDSA